MKIDKISFVAVVIFCSATQVQADETLAQSKGCLNCHNVQNKIVGPAFRDVAAKYKGQDVKKQLVEKVQKGGSGVWGSMPMPPNPVTAAEAEALVSWVLSLN